MKQNSIFVCSVMTALVFANAALVKAQPQIDFIRGPGNWTWNFGGNWAGGNIPNNSGEIARFAGGASNSNVFIESVTPSFTVNGIRVLNSTSTVNITGNRFLSLTGTGSQNSGLRLRLGNTISDGSLTGNSSTNTLLNDSLIDGRGTISAGFTNSSSGRIQTRFSGQVLQITGSEKINQGEIRAVAGGLMRLFCSEINNLGGLIESENGSIVEYDTYINEGEIAGFVHQVPTNCTATLEDVNLTAILFRLFGGSSLVVRESDRRTIGTRFASSVDSTLRKELGGHLTLALGFSSPDFTGTIDVDAGTLTIDVGLFNASNIDIARSGILEFNSGGSAGIFTNLQGSGLFRKSLGGSLNLQSTTHNFTGDFDVAGGMLRGSTNPFENAGSIMIHGGSILSLEEPDSGSIAGLLSGDGVLRNSGNGLVSLSSGGPDFSGSIEVEAGILNVDMATLGGNGPNPPDAFVQATHDEPVLRFSNGSISTLESCSIGSDSPGLDGFMEINSGSEVNVMNNLQIGGNILGDDGRLIIDGHGSTLSVTGLFTDIGNVGHGRLILQNQASADTRILTIGNATTTDTQVSELICNNANLSANESLTVGQFDQAKIMIENGGVVTSQFSRLGNLGGSDGEAVVRDIGSEFNTTTNLIVGLSGIGRLTIENGALVSNASGLLGLSNSGSGNVIVSGTGSTWRNNNNLNVGGSDSSAGGTGMLTIESGGTVNVLGQTRIWPTGTLNFNGGALHSSGGITNSGNVMTDSNSNLTIDGIAISNGGTWHTENGSELMFAQSFSGQGTFSGIGKVTFDNGVNLGSSSAEVTFAGDVELTANSTTFIELGGTDIGDFDRFNIIGDTIIGGNLNVSLINNLLLEDGMQFLIVDVAGSRSGTFGNFNEGDLVAQQGLLDLNITYTAGDGNDIMLFVQPTPVLLGDVNQDGAVNLLDVDPFIEVIGTGNFQAEADCNQDGAVNLLDVDPFIAILSGI